MLHDSNWMMQLVMILVPFSLIYEVSQVFAADHESLWHMKSKRH